MKREERENKRDREKITVGESGMISILFSNFNNYCSGVVEVCARIAGGEEWWAKENNISLGWATRQHYLAAFFKVVFSLFGGT